MKSLIKVFAVVVVAGAALMLLASPGYAFRGGGIRTFHTGRTFHGGYTFHSGNRFHIGVRSYPYSFYGYPYYSSAHFAAYPVYYYRPSYVVYRPSYVVHRRTVVKTRPRRVAARPTPVYKQDRN
jgi:hypothetical protein